MSENETTPALPSTPATGAQGAPPEAGMSAEEEKNWCYAAHLGPLLMIFASGGLAAFVVPLVIWLMKKDENERIAEHARVALNFQLAMVAATFVLVAIGFGTLGFGFLLTIPGLLVVFILQIFGGVRACMQVGKGEPAVYPASLTIVK